MAYYSRNRQIVDDIMVDVFDDLDSFRSVNYASRVSVHMPHVLNLV